MSKAPVVVSKIISKQMSVSEAATAYGVSRQHVHRWLVRYRDHGFDGLEPRPRRPHSHPRRTAWEVAERIVATLRARRSRPRSRAADDRLAPRTGASPGAVYLNDPSDPGGSWAGYSRTKEAAQKLLPVVRSRPAHRMLAIRLHPLAASRRHRRGDHQLARRALPIPSRRHRPATVNGEDVVTTFSPRPTITAFLSRPSLTMGRSTPLVSPAAATASSTYSRAWASPRERPSQPPANPGQDL